MLDSGEIAVAVRIRMKQMGRTHRHYYRIVAQVIFNRFMKKWEELESQEATKVAEEAAKAKATAEAEATAPLG
jgi:hypothetical protein